jgi:hypothetical protein
MPVGARSAAHHYLNLTLWPLPCEDLSKPPDMGEDCPEQGGRYASWASMALQASEWRNVGGTGSGRHTNSDEAIRPASGHGSGTNGTRCGLACPPARQTGQIQPHRLGWTIIPTSGCARHRGTPASI